MSRFHRMSWFHHLISCLILPSSARLICYIGKKGFRYFVPLCWNILLRYLRVISCQETFKAHLKRHLFNNFPLMYLHMLLTLTYDLLPAAPFLVLIITLLVVSSLCLLYYQPITSNWPSFQPTFSSLPLLT